MNNKNTFLQPSITSTTKNEKYISFSLSLHLKGCVEMGLGMIAAMRLFDTKRHEVKNGKKQFN